LFRPQLTASTPTSSGLIRELLDRNPAGHSEVPMIALVKPVSIPIATFPELRFLRLHRVYRHNDMFRRRNRIIGVVG